MHDLILTNTWFKIRESHLITLKNGIHVSQTDLILTRKVNSRCCIDCKVIPGESVTTQCRLDQLDICIRRWRRRDIRQRNSRITWWDLKGEKQDVFKDKMIEEGKWNFDEDIKRMWNELAKCIKRVAKDILGESKGCG